MLLSPRDARLHLLFGEGEAMLIVFGDLPLLLCLAAHLLQPLLFAEAVVGRAPLDQLFGIFLIDLLPLALDIRAKLPAHIRAFIVG